MAAYKWLCGILGGLLVAGGVVFVATYFRFHAPGSDVVGIPTGPVGFYFVGFTGCALVGWGGALLGAARRPETGRTLGTFSALALGAMGLMRMLGWIMGDYYVFLGELLRLEAAIFLSLAVAFLWLRPNADGEFA